MGDLAVGREEEKAGRVVVETPHRKETRVLLDRHERRDSRTSLRVAHGCDDTRGLVERDVHGLIGDGDRHPVEGDGVDQRVHLGAKLGRNNTVDGHAAGGHEVFATSPRRRSGAREELLEAHRNDTLAFSTGGSASCLTTVAGGGGHRVSRPARRRRRPRLPRRTPARRRSTADREWRARCRSPVRTPRSAAVRRGP